MRNNSVVLEGDKCRPFFVHRSGKLVLGGPFEDSSSFRTHCLLRFESRRSQVLNLIGDGRSQLSHLLHDRLAQSHARAVNRPVHGVELGLSDFLGGAIAVAAEVHHLYMRKAPRSIAADHERTLRLQAVLGDDTERIFEGDLRRLCERVAEHRDPQRTGRFRERIIGTAKAILINLNEAPPLVRLPA